MRYTRNFLLERFETLKERYKENAGKKYDPNDGWDQVPRNNIQAAMAYGALDEVKTLLDW